MTPSTKDKRGREQILYDKLRERVRTDETVNDRPVMVARLQIADCCPNLIATISQAPRDEKNSEEIAEFLGDDSLQSSGYGLYAMFHNPPRKSFEEIRQEELAECATPQAKYMRDLQLTAKYQRQDAPLRVRGRLRWMRQ